MNFFSLVYESLITINNDGKLNPELAENWTSEDGGKTWPMIRVMERGEGFTGDENTTNNKQYEYPYLMQGKDGRLHLAFAYKNRIGIKYMGFTEEDVMGAKRETAGFYNPTSAQIK